VNIFRFFYICISLTCLLNVELGIAQTTNPEGYESSFRKNLQQVITSSCGSPPSMTCINNSNEVKNTIRKVCGALQGQDRARCVDIANDTATKAVTSGSPNQAAPTSQSQSPRPQAKSEEAREIEAIEQKRQADIKIEIEQKRLRALKEEQDKRQRAQNDQEQRLRQAQQRQQEADEQKRRESDEKASRQKAAADFKIKTEKIEKDDALKVVAGLKSSFYQDQIKEWCESGWSALKKSKDYAFTQAVRKSSDRELCGCLKESLPKSLAPNFPFEKIESGMKKGKFEDLSAENQGQFTFLNLTAGNLYEICARSAALKGN
jgi:hypothetical protein